MLCAVVPLLSAAAPAGGAERTTGIPGVELFRLSDPGTGREFDRAEYEPGAAEPLVTMVVRDADVAAVLQLLATQYRLNLLTTADVKTTVSFQFNDVPLSTVLDVLTKAAACNYVRNGDVLVVKPIRTEYVGELETRVYNLSYAEAEDVKQTINRLVSNKGNVEVSYRRVADGGGSKRSSVLMVTDYRDNLANMERVISELDQPVPQIAIEAKFVETTMNKADLYGIDWNIVVGVQAKTTEKPPYREGSDVQIPLVLDYLNVGTINLGQLSALLNLLQTKGTGRLLANPRAVTLDNQTAEMMISTQVPLREVRVDPGTQSQTITWRRQSIPIGLRVTPHVLADGTIDMEVAPEVEAITGYVGPPNDQQPITSKREAKTQVRVRDGEVAVIGGLVQEEQTRSVKKVPLLGDIPLLGHLFRSTSVDNKKTDLLIFIIPHVLPAS
jgi:type IV pilus assembly protein PilQ